MSSSFSTPAAAAAPRVVVAFLPIMAVVLIAFLVTGLALLVLPLHVDEDLGLGTFVAGLVAGLRAVFLASALIVLCAALIAVRLMSPPVAVAARPLRSE